MWNLDDESKYIKIHSFKLPFVYTYGNQDKEKRERIRAKAAEGFPVILPKVKWWAFRIDLKKSGIRDFDADNVPKLIVDAFSLKLIHKDRSKFLKLGLYEDDILDFVRIIEIKGERSQIGDSTDVEIFGCK